MKSCKSALCELVWQEAFPKQTFYWHTSNPFHIYYFSSWLLMCLKNREMWKPIDSVATNCIVTNADRAGFFPFGVLESFEQQQPMGWFLFLWRKPVSFKTLFPLNILSGGAFSLLNWVGKIDAQQIFIECVLNK